MSVENEGQQQPVPEDKPEVKQPNRVVEILKNSFTFRRNKSTPRNRAEEPQTIPLPKPEVTKPLEPDESFDRTYAREKDFLAELETPDLKIVPGDHWAMHYPQGIDEKHAALQRLIGGTASPSDETANVTPDALVYDQHDLTQGVEPVRQRIHNVVTSFDNYDFPRMTSFVAEMHGTDLHAVEAEGYYNNIAADKTKHVMLTTYDNTDRPQIVQAVKAELQLLADSADLLSGMDKIMAAAKATSFVHHGVGSLNQQKALEQALIDDERTVYTTFSKAYGKYIESQDEDSYRTVVDAIKKWHTEHEEEEKKSKPPPDNDELQEPPPADREEPPEIENQPKTHLYKVEAAGINTEVPGEHFISEKASLFNQDKKIWEPTVIVSDWTQSVPGDDRYTMHGKIGKDEINIPIPKGYTIDASSMSLDGQPKISRDQTGCFYLKNTQDGEYKVDFVKTDETLPHDVASFADTQTIHEGLLSDEAETLIAQLKGEPDVMTRAQQVIEFVQSHHIYPEHPDQVQIDIRNASTAANYIQNLEASHELECESANTLYIAMLRHAGVPARLIGGYKIDEKHQPSTFIDVKDAHAWTEVWDGEKWVLMDATPPHVQTTTGEGTEEGEAQQGQEGEAKPGENGMPEEAAGDDEVAQGERDIERSKEAVEQADQQRQEFRNQMNDVASFEDLEKLKEEIAANPELFEDMKQALEERAEVKEEQMKDEVKKELDDMVDDGFIDQDAADQMAQLLQDADAGRLDDLKTRLQNENAAYNEYKKIQEEVMPDVDYWYDYFEERLPTEDVLEYDEDSVSRRGTIDRRALRRPSNLMLGRVKNPRVFKPEIRPKILVSTAVDVSWSMGMNASETGWDSSKIDNAKKLMVFFNEFYSKIRQEHGYIRFAGYTFSDSLNVVKRFDQDYDSAERYEYPDKDQTTVKARLMNKMELQDGTDIYQAVRTAAKDLNAEVEDYPDYASTFLFIGDGEDQYSNEANIRRFLQVKDAEKGFGEHSYHAIMLGNEPEKQVLANIFGEDHTTVAPDFDTLITQAMHKWEDDLEDYFDGKI